MRSNVSRSVNTREIGVNVLLQHNSRIKKEFKEYMDKYYPEQQDIPMDNGWRSIKNLPTEDNQLCLFIIWQSEWKSVVNSYVGTYKDVKNFRKFDLTNYYTHWMPLPSPKEEKEG